jgi:hypothetical protein
VRDEQFRRCPRERRTTRSGRSFDEKQIADAVSRCRRVKQILGLL